MRYLFSFFLLFAVLEIAFEPDEVIHLINKYKHGICTCVEAK